MVARGEKSDADKGFAGLSSLVSDVDEVVGKCGKSDASQRPGEPESRGNEGTTQASSPSRSDVRPPAKGLSATSMVFGGLLLFALGAVVMLFWMRGTAPEGSAAISTPTRVPVPTDFVAASPAASNNATPQEVQAFSATHVVAAVNANLREGASARAKVVRVVQRGQSLQALDVLDEFTHVRSNDGATGWIAKELLIPAGDLERLKALSSQQYIEQRASEDRVLALFRQREPQMKSFLMTLFQIGNRSAATQETLAELEGAKAYTLVADEPASIWYGLSAKASIAAGDREAAIRDLRAAIVADPTSADNHIAFALTSYEDGQFEATRAAAKIVPFLAPRTTNAWLVLGLGEALDGKEGIESAATGAFILSIHLSRNPAFTRKYLASLAAKATDPKVQQWISAALKEDSANPDLFPVR